MSFSQADLAADVVLPTERAHILMRFSGIRIDASMGSPAKFAVRVLKVADGACLLRRFGFLPRLLIFDVVSSLIRKLALEAWNAFLFEAREQLIFVAALW